MAVTWGHWHFITFTFKFTCSRRLWLKKRHVLKLLNANLWPSHCVVTAWGPQFPLVTRPPYCRWRPKKRCFTTLSLIPMVSIARLSVVNQSFFGLPGQYGHRVTRVSSLFAANDHVVQNPPCWRASSLLFPHWDMKTKASQASLVQVSLF